jgi:multiple sugar transport system substrate-binding protein
MQRALAVFVVVIALVFSAGCMGDDSSDNSAAETQTTERTPVTITFWSPFTDREQGVINKGIASFEKAYPWIKVKSVGAITADKITAAIHAGNPPDVAAMFETDNLGAFCNSGAWTDLNDRIDADKLDMEQFPETIREYTAYGDKRCAMPLLADAYGFYYNKTLLQKAGIKSPPKSVDELADYAKRLTVRNSDGSLKIVGFDPLLNWYENAPVHWGPMWGATWMKDGKSGLAKDPAWEEMLRWQKKLVDWYGYDKLVRWQAGAGDEFSPSNAFETGKVAMMVDGEYRTAFLKAEHPEVKYGTAPHPTSKPDLYGSGFVIGTIMGIPKGAKHADAGWQLLKFMATDTDTLAEMSNGLHNVPSTIDSQNSPKLTKDPKFGTFLDIFKNEKSSTQPVLKIGSQNQTLFTSFIEKWQAGRVKDEDLHAGLENVDKQIDAALEQAGGEVP